jgi:hypothetical protein
VLRESSLEEVRKGTSIEFVLFSYKFTKRQTNMKLNHFRELIATPIIMVMTMQLVLVGGQGGYHGMGHGGDEGGGGDWPMHEEDSFHGGRPHGGCGYSNDDFFNMSLYLTNLTDCSDNFTCFLPRGENGTFVCRETFHPVTGESISMVRCTPTDMAWKTDVCGCCVGVCPVDLFNSTGGRGHSDNGEEGLVPFPIGSESVSAELSYSNANVLIGRAWIPFSIVSMGLSMFTI